MNYPTDYGRVVVTMPKDEKRALIKHCEQTGHTLTWLVRDAIKSYIMPNLENKQKNKNGKTK
jgi:hypothetical protein